MTDVVRFIKLTDCAPLAKIFQEQVEILLSFVSVVPVHVTAHLTLLAEPGDLVKRS